MEYVPDCLYQPFPIAGDARAQIWRYAPEYRRPRHFHAEPELNLVVAGSGTFRSGDARIPVGAGDLLCWPPGRDHELAQASPDFDLFVIGARPDFSERVLGTRNRMALAGPTCIRLAPAAQAQLLELCGCFPDTADRVAIETRVGALWREGHAARLRQPAGSALARRTLETLLEQPELARDQRSRLVHAAPSELSRAFHRQLGSTLSSYRSRLRLLAFIEIVDAGEETLLAAALRAGFGSYSQCHRTFQHTLGCAPGAFFGSALRRTMADTFCDAA